MTRLIQFANNATSRLAANLSAVGVTATLIPGDGPKFPTLSAGQYFMATLIKADGNKEIIKVTARSSDTLTIVRAAEPVAGVQTAYSFNAADKIELRLTAGELASEFDRLDKHALTGVLNKSANYTVVADDVSTLVRVDSTAGATTITLPLISSLTEDFILAVAKVSNDSNSVYIAGSGGNTINGATPYALVSQWQGAWLVADRSTNTWTAVSSGVGSSFVFVDKFTGTGAQTVFTMSAGVYSSNQVEVTISGVTQNPGIDYTASGTTLTFTTAPPNSLVILARYTQSSPQISTGTCTIEKQTATSGQTGFALANGYMPGSNTMQVFVNGLLMSEGTDYTETGANSVAFTSGLTMSDEVQFVVFGRSIGTVDAANASYTPAGTGAVATTVQAELRSLDDQATHIRSQKPAAYSFPRFMKTLESYRTDLRPAINIVGFGSSVGVGATLPTPSTQAPVAYFSSKLKATIDIGNLFNFVTYNDSVNGSTVSESLAVLTTAVSAHTPKICVLAYGMNDSSPAIFNSGQTYPAVYTSISKFVTQARAAGSDVVLMTTPHHKVAGFTYTLPGGIAQVYPTSIAAPVGAEAMTPPASASTITGDFIGDGSSISVSHRSLRVNQAMRQAATDMGVPLIDVERYWFKAVRTYGEAALFDSGETVHPNLLGHQQSYWIAIDEFVESLARQTSQEGQEPRLNGLVGVNNSSPTAVLDVDIPYPDMTSPPLQVRARVGVTDANGVKASAVTWKVDPANGDLVGYGVSVVDSSSIECYRHHALVSAGTVYSKMVTESCYVTLLKTSLGGQVNASGTVTVIAVPDNSFGTIRINGYQNGVGRRRTRVEWISNGGAISFGTADSAGAATFTGPTSSGLNIQVTCFAAGTSLNYELVSNSGI